MRNIVFSIALLLCLPAALLAVENFPPPEFTQGYRFPATSVPGPRDAWLSWLDVTVLLIALSVAAYLVVRARSRQHLVTLVLFSLLYFGFYRRGCICSVGALQNVVLALWRKDYVLPATVGAFFLLPILFALFFGRVFCAGVCPLGAAQELVLLRPKRTPRWLDDALGTIPYVYLGFAVLFAATNSAFIVCEYDPFVLFFRLGGSVLMLALGVAILLLSTVIGRPYCRYFCPYGLVLRWMSHFARWQARISPEECVNCHLCAKACPYGAILPPSPEGQPVARTEGKRRLVLLLVLMPVLVLGAAGLTRLAAPMLSHMHRTVRLADRIWLEEHQQVTGKTDESDAFATLGLESSDLYRDAAAVRAQYEKGSWFLGTWIGLVFGLRMIGLSIRRKRTEYQIDTGSCVACGRCYQSCPVHHAGGLPETVDLAEGAR